MLTLKKVNNTEAQNSNNRTTSVATLDGAPVESLDDSSTSESDEGGCSDDKNCTPPSPPVTDGSRDQAAA